MSLFLLSLSHSGYGGRGVNQNRPLSPSQQFFCTHPDMIFQTQYNSCRHSLQYIDIDILINFRYWAVTYPHYIHTRSSASIWMLISFVWIMSIVVSLAPLFGWKDDNWSKRVNEGECMVRDCLSNYLSSTFLVTQVSQEISYQIFATSATFFVPLILILLLYWRIFITAR